jgi:hypothetical protein
VISIMGLTRVVFNIPLAAMGDRMGRRPLLIAGEYISPAFGRVSGAVSLRRTNNWEQPASLWFFYSF